MDCGQVDCGQFSTGMNTDHLGRSDEHTSAPREARKCAARVSVAHVFRWLCSTLAALEQCPQVVLGLHQQQSRTLALQGV